MYQVPGYKDLMATEDGRLFSVSRDMWLIPRELKTKWGAYHRVTVIPDEGKPRRELWHVLICSTFHGPQPSQEHNVNHKDGVKINNGKDNVEWTTVAENNKHARDTGLNRSDKKTQCKFKNYVTGEEREFFSVQAVIDAGLMSKPTALRSYNDKELINGCLIIPRDRFFYPYSREDVAESVRRYTAMNGWPIVVKCYLNDTERKYDNYRSFLSEVTDTGITPTHINARVATGRIWPIRGFAFKYAHNPNPFPVLDKTMIEYSFDPSYHWGVTKDFEVVNHVTGKIKRLGGFRRVGEYLNIPMDRARYFFMEKGGRCGDFEIKLYQPS